MECIRYLLRQQGARVAKAPSRAERSQAAQVVQAETAVCSVRTPLRAILRCFLRD